jgi:hypothetical protein
MNHCDVKLEVKVNGNEVGYLTLANPDPLTETMIELTTPPDNSLIGPQLGQLTLRLVSDNHMILSQDFTVTLDEPSCTNLELDPASIPTIGPIFTQQFGSPDASHVIV